MKKVTNLVDTLNDTWLVGTTHNADTPKGRIGNKCGRHSRKLTDKDSTILSQLTGSRYAQSVFYITKLLTFVVQLMYTNSLLFANLRRLIYN